MQKMMDCVVFSEVGKYEITQKPVPQIKRPNDVLVKILACSICGTDVHILADPPQYPAIPGTTIGHEIVGEVVEFGESVQGLEVGDHLIMDNNIDRKSTRLNSSHNVASRMPSSA